MIDLASDAFECHKETRDVQDDSFDREPRWCQNGLGHDYRKLFALL